MSTIDKVPLLRQSHPPENYTAETVGFGIGMAVGLGGLFYEGYKSTKPLNAGFFAGFITTLAVSTFGLIRARQHHYSQQAHLKDRKIDNEKPTDSKLNGISDAVSQLIKSLQIEMPPSTADSIQETAFEFEQSRILRQLECLAQYQESKAAELNQALEKMQQLQAQTVELSETIQSQKAVIAYLQSQKPSGSIALSTITEEMEKQYLGKIESLQSKLDLTSKELDIVKEMAENFQREKEFYEEQVARLDEMVRYLSKGSQSPSSNTNSDSSLSPVIDLFVDSREGSRSSSTASSPRYQASPREGFRFSSATDSPRYLASPMASPAASRLHLRRALFNEPNPPEIVEEGNTKSHP